MRDMHFCPPIGGPMRERFTMRDEMALDRGPRRSVRPREIYSTDEPQQRRLSDDDVAAVVDAIEQLDWVQWCKGEMLRGSTWSSDPLQGDTESVSAPMEQYQRHEAEVLRYSAELESTNRYNRADVLQYAARADAEYRESRRAIADRAAQFALETGVSYEVALRLTGASEPLALVPAS